MYECETCGAVGNWKTEVKSKIWGDYVLNTYYCDDCTGYAKDDCEGCNYTPCICHVPASELGEGR